MHVLLATDDPGIGLGGWLGIIIGGSVLAAVLWTAAVIFIVLSPRYTVGGKILWIVAALWPIVGPLAWFVFGRWAKLLKDPASTELVKPPSPSAE